MMTKLIRDIPWDTSVYSKPTDCQVADIEGGRLMVRRARKGARTFDGYFNSRYLGRWDTLEIAQEQVTKLYKERLL